MRVEKGKTLIARGELRIEGDAEVLGCNIKSFRSDKYVPIYCKSDCDIHVDGDYIVVDRDTIPDSWKKLVKKDWETLFIYGGVDSGKSTLATYLANKIKDCYILDLDIGQSDIAHPTAMGYGYTKGNIVSLSEIEMINGFFVGVLSPTGREARCLRGVERLWKEIKNLDAKKIIDTTGWIRGKRAKEYKLAKIEIIQPDLIASFEGTPTFLEDYEVFEVERGFVIERNRNERMKTRISNYRLWLENAETIELRLSDIMIKNTNLFKGKRIVKDFIQDVLGVEVLFVERGDDFLNVCVAEKPLITSEIVKSLKELYNVDEICIFKFEDLKDLLVGLYKGNRYLGFGILKEIDEEKIKILTKAKDFDRVEFGEIKFDGEKELIARIP